MDKWHAQHLSCTRRIIRLHQHHYNGAGLHCLALRPSDQSRQCRQPRNSTASESCLPLPLAPFSPAARQLFCTQPEWIYERDWGGNTTRRYHQSILHPSFLHACDNAQVWHKREGGTVTVLCLSVTTFCAVGTLSEIENRHNHICVSAKFPWHMLHRPSDNIGNLSSHVKFVESSIW